jgi:F-type H+-transporting ATPase subunit epsilon
LSKHRSANSKCRFSAGSSGLVKVENNEVLVLVDSAERPEDIDENRAKRAAAEAKEAMLQKRSIQEYQQAQANLARAINRLRIKNNVN